MLQIDMMMEKQKLYHDGKTDQSAVEVVPHPSPTEADKPSGSVIIVNMLNMM